MTHRSFPFSFVLLTLLLPIAAAVHVNAAQGGASASPMWKPVTERSVSRKGTRTVDPDQYRIFRLDEARLKAVISPIPSAYIAGPSQPASELLIPMPDGTIQRFRIVRNNTLSPELEKAFPQWRTFTGTGIDDPSAVGEFDWNSLGFHGYITTDKGTVYIDPYQGNDRVTYLVYYKHQFGPSKSSFYCGVEPSIRDIVFNSYQPLAPQAPNFGFGTSVRTFRIAIATTGEWSRNAAGYTEGMSVNTIRTNALAVVATTVNRLNGIFRRELASTFQLVNPVPASPDNIIFDDPETDPYDNTDGEPQLGINQTTIDTRVGAANYDVGHLYGTGGGGVASTPSICSSSQKAEGYSARGTDTGDPFTIDYVAHELGHQFGAEHTYNNSDPDGACTTRSAPDAFEVASGATIMSYVGICSQRNLQQYVDTGLSSFHIRSLTTIHANLTTGDPSQTGCGAAAGTNSIPTVTTGNSVTIPKLTPFTLTAEGNDADATDVANLLYSWEQYDLSPQASGALGTPADTYDTDSDGVLRPLLRPYSPVSSSSRTFPSLTFILNPQNNDPAGSNQPPLTYTGTHPTGLPGAVCETNVTCVIGELLPSITRVMNFRVAVRDRQGGVADAGTTVTVAGDAGPFRVTTQDDQPVTWTGASQETITWDVANTTAEPVNAANVNILLSTDGGLTFPTTILANTPNDGTEAVTVPNVATTSARIRVEAVDNVFFDISNVNFTIVAAPASPVVQFSSSAYIDGEARSALITITRTGDVSGTSTLTFSTVPGGTAAAGGSCGSGADYITASQTVTFTAGQTSQTVSVPLCSDLLAEPTETVMLALTGPSAGTSLGTQDTALLSITDAASQYRNETAITVTQGSAANLYPSTINVTGAPSNVFRIRVTLFGFMPTPGNHVDVLLVGPNGAKYVLMGHVGSPTSLTSPVTLTFFDAAAAVLPASGPLTSGSFLPTNCDTANDFPAPAPAGPYVDPGCNAERLPAATLYGAFSQQNGNGVWSLFVRDDEEAASAVVGTIMSGWGIELLSTTSADALVSGRVLAEDGRGLRNARVTMVDSRGAARTVTTSSLGYYRFDEVQTGETYIISVASKRYRFSTNVLQVIDSLTEVDFVGLE